MRARRRSLMSQIERWTRANNGVLRITFEPEMEPKWHGVLTGDGGKHVVAPNRYSHVLRRLAASIAASSPCSPR